MSGMQQQLLGIGLVMGLVQVAKRLDLEDPAKLPYLRASYLTAQVICLAIYGYIYTQIQAKKDTTPLNYEEKKGFSQEATQVSTTVGEYDRAELMKALQGVVMGMAFLGFLHLKLGYVQPLFLQSILPLKNLFDNKLVKIYILGQKAEGTLKRPWVAPNPFGMPAEEPAADAQPVEAAAESTATEKKEGGATKRANKKKSEEAKDE